ncbi:cerebral cavernous malformations 2 protein-like [Littorina saxatilis]|uniref:Cerebral cavernous malformations 2 harmonin-homology domain-containing protein n=1 Tax=Littorina saxatilis TaxID=31220 RepID=A0AAN9B893_9CAEN
MLAGARWKTTNDAVSNRQVEDPMLDPEVRSKMTPPDYHNLLEDPVEKQVLYAGVIGEVAVDIDITNRTDVLRIIDKGKKHGGIPSHVTYDYHAAILSLSTYNIKINKRNGDDLLLRIPMHEIAAMCYIKDDKQHILAIKFGTPEMCQLAVLYCDSKPVAEELCSLVGHCFQTIYLQGVIGFFDQSINNPSGSPSTGGSTTIPNHQPPPSISDSDFPSPTYHAPSDKSSIKSIGGELLADYMNKLHKELNAKELQLFAQVLPDLENRFPEFCERVLQLYGSDRRHLLAEMLPFIPADNLSYFEDFLTRNGIGLGDNGGTLSSSRTNLRGYPTRRSIGEVSTTSSVSNNPTSDDRLHELLELSESQFDSVLVDTDPAKYVPNADY